MVLREKGSRRTALEFSRERASCGGRLGDCLDLQSDIGHLCFLVYLDRLRNSSNWSSPGIHLSQSELSIEGPKQHNLCLQHLAYGQLFQDWIVQLAARYRCVSRNFCERKNK